MRCNLKRYTWEIRDWPLHFTFCQIFFSFNFCVTSLFFLDIMSYWAFYLPSIIILLFVVAHKTWTWAQTLHSQLCFMRKLGMLHVHQESMKKFITHIMSLSGENRIGTQDSLEWFEQRDGWQLWFILWLECGAVVIVPVHGSKFVWLELPLWCQEECLAFLLACPDGEQKRKR